MAGAAGRRRGPRLSTVLGLVLLLGGLSVLGWAAWQYWGTNILSERQAGQARTQLVSKWEQGKGSATTPSGAATPVVPSQKPVPGDAMALMRIPKFGSDWEWPIWSGTSVDVLAKGVGWYEDTAQPGEVGNFAVAAHRVTHGEPFRRLLELEKGDQVIVETATQVLTYELDTSAAQLTVADTESWVLDPVPGKPTQKPTQRLLTLTTCQDLFHSPDRSVAFAHLVKTENK